mmetsp:Transcript_23177/g.32357  ORF Transcript_23177/g.32357 Transcript_23177/m.32357 type:complete len:331 (-) Transcript_23177:178-1170(-)
MTLEIKETFLQELVDRLFQNDPSLTRIYVNNRSEFGDEECKTLGPRLVGSAVKKLIIQKTSMAHIGATAIANALTLSQVETVRLWNNKIGDEGCVAFGGLLTSPNCRVKELILARNHIGNEGLKHICRGLKENSSVKTLSLLANHISHYHELRDMLKINQSIKMLNLIGNQNLEHPEIQSELVEAAEHNYRLECFVVWDNPILSVPQKQINFYTEFNKTGRRMILRRDDIPAGVWAHVFAQLCKEPNYVFYFLKAKPELFQDHNQGPPPTPEELEMYGVGEYSLAHHKQPHPGDDDNKEVWGHFFRRKRRRADNNKAEPTAMMMNSNWMW